MPRDEEDRSTDVRAKKGDASLKVVLMKKHLCDMCGWIYDPLKGEPTQGILPGTPFEELPDDFVCPDCGAAKERFSPKG